MSDDLNTTAPTEQPDDDPTLYDDPTECWQCNGEGGWEDDDPFWPIDWVTCDVCHGKGRWVCEAVEAPDV